MGRELQPGAVIGHDFIIVKSEPHIITIDLHCTYIIYRTLIQHLAQGRASEPTLREPRPETLAPQEKHEPTRTPHPSPSPNLKHRIRAHTSCPARPRYLTCMLGRGALQSEPHTCSALGKATCLRRSDRRLCTTKLPQPRALARVTDAPVARFALGFWDPEALLSQCYGHDPCSLFCRFPLLRRFNAGVRVTRLGISRPFCPVRFPLARCEFLVYVYVGLARCCDLSFILPLIFSKKKSLVMDSLRRARRSEFLVGGCVAGSRTTMSSIMVPSSPSLVRSSSPRT